MNELSKYGAPGGVVARRQGRAMKQAMELLVTETQYEAKKLDAEAAKAGRKIELTVELERYRRELCDGDEMLWQLTLPTVMNFARQGQTRRPGGGILEQQ